MTLGDPAFRLIFEHASVGIVVVDAELRILDANAAYCEMLGYTKQELLKLRIPELTHPQDRQRDIEFLPHLLAGRIPRYRAEKRYITKKGETVWANIVGTALFDESGKARYAFGIAENITERKALRGLLPVCSSCKKVRDDKGYWNQVEAYLKEHAGAEVAHALCPECLRKQPPE